jgi:transposase-like protein
MKYRNWSQEQKLALLEEVKTNGIARTSRKHGVAQGVLYRWRDVYSVRGAEGLKSQRSGERQDSRVTELEIENQRLKKLLAERDLELDVVKEIIKKNPWGK